VGTIVDRRDGVVSLLPLRYRVYWRQSQEVGFTLDVARGDWVRRPDEDHVGGLSKPDTGFGKASYISGVRLLVRGTRNILLVRPVGETGRRLPDYAQPHLADYPARPDFYYEAARACVFCDGAVHDRPEVQAEDRHVRADLEDLGYWAVVIRYDRDLEEQVQGYPDVFGSGQ